MKIITPSCLILGLFVLGGMIFKLTSPLSCGPILPNDNVFVLTGDARRIPYALQQTQKYPMARIHIIGVGGHYFNPGRARVAMETKSKSTYQNALAIRNIVNQQHLDRIVVVTTEEHMKRAVHLIHHEIPRTDIVTCSAPLTGMPAGRRLERWTIEYLKYIVTLFGFKEG
ncbi:MAG: YdcF family protein [Alphaproteobacteria bacterium]|nr:YdcF family protein [Alphaproteobacteria bacterium]